MFWDKTFNDPNAVHKYSRKMDAKVDKYNSKKDLIVLVFHILIEKNIRYYIFFYPW